MPIITIVIPTYNRAKALQKNISQLSKQLVQNRLEEDIMVLISDNASSKEDKKVLKESIERFSGRIELFEQTNNIGFEENLLFLLRKVLTPYVMLLGDDDYISTGYLVDAINTIKNDRNIRAVIPNYYQVNDEGVAISDPRDPVRDNAEYQQYEGLEILSKAHQMSGLIFSMDGMLQSYEKNVAHNVYPQIYFLGYSAINGKLVHITHDPIQNTVLTKKNFTYEFDNLFDQMIVNIDALDIDMALKIKTFVKFSRDNQNRYLNPLTKRHPYRLIKKIVNEYAICYRLKIVLVIEIIRYYVLYFLNMLVKK